MKAKAFFRLLKKRLIGHQDPLLHCDAFRNDGCAHIDGMLCDFPHCSIFKAERRRVESA